MVKIKREVKKNLPQLIEWAWDNEIKNKRYRRSDSNPYEYVWINENSDIELDEDVRISKHDTFTVEEEIEITEDTVIPRLITRNTHGGYNEWTNESVNGFNLTHVEAIYIPNDDLTLTLIWTKDKGLVE